MRHFRIPHRQYQWMDSRGFDDWSHWYDHYEVSTPAGISPLIGWDSCYCSDLLRAQKTARAFYQGEIKAHAALREVPFAPIVKTHVHLPLLVWQALSRLAWNYAHGSQSEIRDQTFRRIDGLLDELEANHSNQKVLLVTHGFLMQYLQKQLRRRGYRGQLPMRPVWGEVYIFEGE